MAYIFSRFWEYLYYTYILPYTVSVHQPPRAMLSGNLLEWRRYMALLTIFFLSIIFLWQRGKQNLPPGPWGLPVVGSLMLFRKKPHIQLTLLKERYGDIYSVRIGNYQAVVLCSMDGIREGLVRLGSSCSGRSSVLSSHLLYKGNSQGGVSASDPDEVYLAKKDFIQLSIDQLCTNSEGLEEVISNECLDLLAELIQYSKPCDPSFLIESMSLRLMLYIVNGKLYEATDESFMEIWKTYQLRSDACAENWMDFIPLLRNLQKQKWMDILERSALLFKYQRKIINRHKDCYNPSIIHDLVDEMLLHLETDEDKGVLDQDDLDQLFVELSGSGFLTTSQTLRWLLLYVTAFPDTQNQVQEELLSVVGKDRLPKMSDQPYLPFTCAVVMETQRLASVLPLLIPHRTTEKVNILGYDIPQDTLLYFNIWSLHHDTRYWRNPTKFNPSRFLKEDGTLHIPDYFLPYGSGLRACPGQSLADIQIFLVFTNLLHQVTLSRDPDQPVSLSPVYRGPVLSPKPFKVKVTPRSLLVLSEIQRVD